MEFPNIFCTKIWHELERYNVYSVSFSTGAKIEGSEEDQKSFQPSNTYMKIDEQTEPMDFSTNPCRPTVCLPISTNVVPTVSRNQQIGAGQATYQPMQYSQAQPNQQLIPQQTYSHQTNKPFPETSQQTIFNVQPSFSASMNSSSGHYTICVTSSTPDTTCMSQNGMTTVTAQACPTLQYRTSSNVVHTTPISKPSQMYPNANKPLVLAQQSCYNPSNGIQANENKSNVIITTTTSTTAMTNSMTTACPNISQTHLTTAGRQNSADLHRYNECNLTAPLTSGVVPISGPFQVTSTLIVPTNKVVSFTKLESDNGNEIVKSAPALMQLSPRYITAQTLPPTVVEVGQNNINIPRNVMTPLIQIPQNTVYMTQQNTNNAIKTLTNQNQQQVNNTYSSQTDNSLQQVTINYPIKPQTPPRPLSCAMQKIPTITSSIGHSANIKQEIVHNSPPLGSHEVSPTYQQLSVVTSESSAGSKQSSPMQPYSPPMTSPPYAPSCQQNSVKNSHEQENSYSVCSNLPPSPSTSDMDR